MIIALFGRPGSGKSYSAVALSIIPAIKAGRPVRTNVPLKLEAIQRDYSGADVQVIQPEALNSDLWATLPNGALVVLDELGKLWPSGMKANRVDRRDLEFIAEHRHRVGMVQGQPIAMDIVLISQGSTDIAAWLRSKIAQTLIVSDLSAVGQDRRYRVDRYSDFQDSERPKKSTHLASVLGQYKPDIYQYYVSHSRATPGVDLSGVTEIGATKRVTIFQSWRFKFYVAALFVGIVGLLWAGTETKQGIEERKERVRPAVEVPAATASRGVAAPSVAPPPAPVPIDPKPKTDWYIGGYAEWQREGQAAHYTIQLRHVQGLQRLVTPEAGACSKRIGILTCDLGGGLVVSDVPATLSIVAGVAPQQ